MTSPQGIGLDRYLQTKGAVPPAQAVRLAWQVVQKLAGELSPGYGGRPPTLHPGRLLVTSSGGVDVLPGSTDDSPVTRASNFPAYTSPEEIKGEQGDFRSQFYSLGCTLFEVLAGQPPYVGGTPKETLRSQVRDAIPDVRDHALSVDEQLAGLVKELLYKDPEFRLQDVNTLLKRLKVAMAAKAAAVHPAPPPPPPKKSAPGHGARHAAPSHANRGGSRRGGRHAPLRSSRSRLSRKRARPDHDTWDDEDLGEEHGYSLIPKKAYPFTWTGVAIGVCLAIVVWVASLRNAKDVVRTNEEFKANRVVTVQSNRKKEFQDMVQANRENVQKTLDKVQRLAREDARPDYKLGMILKHITSVCDKPGAVALAEELDKLNLPRAGQKVASESSYSQADYKKRMEEIESVRSGGRLGAALKVALDAYDAHEEKHGKEIDGLIEDISDEIARRQTADEQRYANAAADGDYERALKIAKGMLAYIDDDHRNEAEDLQKSAEHNLTTSLQSSDDDDDDDDDSEIARDMTGDDDDEDDFGDLEKEFGDDDDDDDDDFGDLEKEFGDDDDDDDDDFGDLEKEFGDDDDDDLEKEFGDDEDDDETL